MADPAFVQTASDGTGRVVQTVRRFRLAVVEGPAQGQTIVSSADRCGVGSSPTNDLVLADPTVSRFHCEIRIDEEGVRVFDLRSRNGTAIDGVMVREAFVRDGSTLKLGRTSVRFDLDASANELRLSEATRFGSLVGSSLAMRRAFALLERAAASEATVLLEGETGTGKSAAAESLHAASPRRDRPFVAIDCAGIPANLVESELFGHERGAFTGAAEARAGAFEDAGGGTVFLDEIGELPLEAQPKLLRVLEKRSVRRVGSNAHRPVDVRLVAATNRDLRLEVNAGRFRQDLYFRLAVIRIAMPPLRQRAEDFPALVEDFLAGARATPEQAARLRAPELLERLRRAAWPGNIRELRNTLERNLVLCDAGEALGPDTGGGLDLSLPFTVARRQLVDDFEVRYLGALLEASGGKVAAAAAMAGIDRVQLYRLLRRHGMR